MDVHKVFRPFRRHFRSRRMREFERRFGVTDATTIIDVGGTQYNWQFLESRPRVTIVNLSRPRNWDVSLDQFTFEVGDGTALEYSDKAFDIAYSNSVIEHLGSHERQIKFARELKRVGRRTYVQTPAYEFFVEPHMLTPLVHWLPLRVQRRMMRNFTLWGLLTRPSQAYIDGFLAERRLLRYGEFRDLFEESEILRERFLAMTKSYIAVGGL